MFRIVRVVHPKEMSSGDTVSSVRVPLRQQPLKQLNKIARRPPVDIEFQDLTYSVPDANVRAGKAVVIVNMLL